MARRPNRSDENLSAEEAARIEAEVRDYFEKVTPKRPCKPCRSDPSDLIGSTEITDSIPEFDKLQQLQSCPQRLMVDGGEATEEYVATEYYDGINCIDKQHHTTGTGFIKVENTNGTALDVERVSYTTSANSSCYKSNPAMNDWIPSAETVIPVSTKPNRSES